MHCHVDFPNSERLLSYSESRNHDRDSTAEHAFCPPTIVSLYAGRVFKVSQESIILVNVVDICNDMKMMRPASPCILDSFFIYTLLGGPERHLSVSLFNLGRLEAANVLFHTTCRLFRCIISAKRIDKLTLWIHEVEED